MIIQNGYIQPIIRKDGYIDDQGGHPVAAQEKYGCLVPCQWQTTTYNAFSRDNGETTTRQGYSVLIEERHPVLTGTARLFDRNRRIIGTFQVISTEPLDAVCQTRLILR